MPVILRHDEGRSTLSHVAGAGAQQAAPLCGPTQHRQWWRQHDPQSPPREAAAPAAFSADGNTGAVNADSTAGQVSAGSVGQQPASCAASPPAEDGAGVNELTQLLLGLHTPAANKRQRCSRHDPAAAAAATQASTPVRAPACQPSADSTVTMKEILQLLQPTEPPDAAEQPAEAVADPPPPLTVPPAADTVAGGYASSPSDEQVEVGGGCSTPIDSMPVGSLASCTPLLSRRGVAATPSPVPFTLSFSLSPHELAGHVSRVLLAGVFLTDSSRSILLCMVPPRHSTVCAHHMLLSARPTVHQLLRLPLGSEVKLQVLAVAADGTAQAVAVGVPPWLPPTTAASAHIPVSLAAGIDPAAADLLIAREGSCYSMLQLEDRFELLGHVGLLMTDRSVIFSLEDLVRGSPAAAAAIAVASWSTDPAMPQAEQPPLNRSLMTSLDDVACGAEPARPLTPTAPLAVLPRSVDAVGAGTLAASTPPATLLLRHGPQAQDVGSAQLAAATTGGAQGTFPAYKTMPAPVQTTTIATPPVLQPGGHSSALALLLGTHAAAAATTTTTTSAASTAVASTAAAAPVCSTRLTPPPPTPPVVLAPALAVALGVHDEAAAGNSPGAPACGERATAVDASVLRCSRSFERRASKGKTATGAPPSPAPSTPNADGVPFRSSVHVGDEVCVRPLACRPGAPDARGVVEELLADEVYQRGGVLVMLEDGTIGRVCRVAASDFASVTESAGGSDDGCSTPDSCEGAQALPNFAETAGMLGQLREEDWLPPTSDSSGGHNDLELWQRWSQLSAGCDSVAAEALLIACGGDIAAAVAELSAQLQPGGSGRAKRPSLRRLALSGGASTGAVQVNMGTVLGQQLGAGAEGQQDVWADSSVVRAQLSAAKDGRSAALTSTPPKPLTPPPRPQLSVSLPPLPQPGAVAYRCADGGSSKMPGPTLQPAAPAVHVHITAEQVRTILNMFPGTEAFAAQQALLLHAGDVNATAEAILAATTAGLTVTDLLQQRTAAATAPPLAQQQQQQVAAPLARSSVGSSTPGGSRARSLKVFAVDPVVKVAADRLQEFCPQLERAVAERAVKQADGDVQRAYRYCTDSTELTRMRQALIAEAALGSSTGGVGEGQDPGYSQAGNSLAHLSPADRLAVQRALGYPTAATPGGNEGLGAYDACDQATDSPHAASSADDPGEWQTVPAAQQRTGGATGSSSIQRPAYDPADLAAVASVTAEQRAAAKAAAAKAHDLFRIHNKARITFLQASHAARRAGDLAKYQQYRQESLKHMDAANAHRDEANRLACYAHNSVIQNTVSLDLHMMMSSEAMVLLEGWLRQLRGLPRAGCTLLRVITGKGNHSANGKPVIKTNVLRYLKDGGYKFEVDKDNPGVVNVKVPGAGQD